MVDISDGIQFRREEVDPSQWPKLSCSQANQTALELSDLRLDAQREILFQGNGQLRASGDILFMTGKTTSEKLRILTNGNVGIGTKEPQAKLEVFAGRLRVTKTDSNNAGVLELSNGSKINYLFTDGSTGNLYIRTDSKNHHLLLQAGGTQGNVGIGTTDAQNQPGDKLEIVSSEDPFNGLTVREPGTGSVSLNLKNNNGKWHISGPRSFEPGNRLSIFWNNNSSYLGPYLSIQDNGNVGIDTGGLSVKGDINVSGRIVSTRGLSPSPNVIFNTDKDRFPCKYPTPNDAQLLFYDYGGGNWAGIGVNTSGYIWIRAGWSDANSNILLIGPDRIRATTGLYDRAEPRDPNA